MPPLLANEDDCEVRLMVLMQHQHALHCLHHLLLGPLYPATEFFVMDDALQDHLVFSRVATIAFCRRIMEVEARYVHDIAALHAHQQLVLPPSLAARVDLDLASA